MAELPLDQAVPRFKANEDRLDTFVNSATGYTTSGGTSVQSIQQFLASIGSNGIDFVDNAKARFGTGNDLEIYHSDVSGSFIRDTGTGDLTIDGSAISIQTASAERVSVSASGIDVTGTVEFDGLSGTGSVTITDIADEDNMASNSATKLATQQSIKAYVDTQVATIPTGDITSVVAGTGLTGGGTTGDVTLNVIGGTGITANADNIAIDGTVATLTGTQTFTNKTLTSAVLNTSVSGTAVLDEDNMVSDSATKLATQQSIKAYVDANAGGGGLPTTGGTMTGDILFNDGVKAKYGTSSDLQIYHDGTHNWIKDVGTGALFLDTNSAIHLYANGSENMLYAQPNAGVQVFYDNVKKLETTSTGIDVTGKISMFDTGGTQLKIGYNSTYFWEIGREASNGRLGFFETSAGTSSGEHMSILPSGNVGIGTTSPADLLDVRGDGADTYIRIGSDTVSGNDAGRIGKIDSSTDFVIQASLGATASNTIFKRNTTAETMRIDASGNVSIASGNLNVTGKGTYTGAGSFEALELKTTDANRVYVTGNSTTSGDMWRLGTSTSNANLNIDALQSNGEILLRTGGTTERMRINSGGIDVTGHIQSDTLTVSSGTTGWLSTMTNPTASGNGLQIYAGNNSGDRILQLADKDGNEAMRVTGERKVGIGTSAPSTKIEVNGDIGIGRVAGAYTFREVVGGSERAGMHSNASNELIFKTGAATERMRLTSSGIDVTGAVSINASSAPTWDTDTHFWAESGFGVRYDGYQHRWDVGLTRTEAMRIDSSGNVSIAGGNLNVTGNATATGTLKTTKSGTNQALFNATVDLGTNTRGFQLTSPSSDSGSAAFKWETGNSILWEIDGAESKSMFLDSAGNLGLGTYSQSAKLSVAGGVTVSSTIEVGSLTPAQDGAIEVGVLAFGTPAIASTTDSTLLRSHIIFDNPNGVVGKINTLGSGTSYVTSSDYRLKTDVQAMTGSIDRLKALRPVNFEWIVDGTRIDGFLAHEAQEVVPEAVDGEKDAMRDQQYVESKATGDIYTPAVEATYETIQVELTPAVEAVYETVTVEISPAVEATYDEEGNELTPAVEAVTEEQEQLVTPAVDATYEEQQQELTPAIDEVIHSSDVVEPDELEEGQRWRETTEKVMATRQVPDYQGIDQSKLVPLLTSALQDAIAKIEALETRLEALET